MTSSFTTSTSFTRTHAIYIASKVAADLQQMQVFYNSPTDAEINDYIEELIILLLNGCLNMVEYGFVRNGEWIVVAKYTARFGAVGSSDDRPGRIPANANVSGATWSSFLEYSPKWSQMSESDRARLQSILPIQRVTGNAPEIGVGGWQHQRTYSRNGVALDRGVYRAQ